jgi:MFS family permease
MNQSRPSLFRLLGVEYFPLAFIARFPYAMMIVGVLTLVVSARGSVQIAGINSALVGIGTALSAPIIGAAADRLGQRRTILVTASLNTVAMLVLTWAAFGTAPVWLVYVLGFCVGASAPQISPMSRSRLVHTITKQAEPARRPKLFSQGFAIDSTLDETSFVFGPVLVGLLATLVNGWLPMVAAAALTLVFGYSFALHRTSPPAIPKGHNSSEVAPVRELLRLRIIVVVLGTTSMGVLFGSTLTSLTALMGESGQAESAGLWYGIMGIGSSALALSVSWFSPRFPKRARWVVFGALVAVGTLTLLLWQTPIGTVLALIVAGIGIGPVLVTFYGFAADRSPAGWSATVMTALNSGLVLGQSLAAAITGSFAEWFGTTAALAVPFAGGLLIFGTGVLNFLITPAGREHTGETAPITVVDPPASDI